MLINIAETFVTMQLILNRCITVDDTFSEEGEEDRKKPQMVSPTLKIFRVKKEYRILGRYEIF